MEPRCTDAVPVNEIQLNAYGPANISASLASYTL